LGVKDIKTITNIEVSQIKNLRLKIDDLKSRIGAVDDHPHTDTSEDEESDEEIKTDKKSLASRKAR
jgi:hypothetical protein